MLDLNNAPTIVSTIAIIIANNTICQNPPTSNLLPNKKSVKDIIKTVIKKEINPKVKIFKGSVKILRIKPMVPFTKPMINPAKIAQPKLSTFAAGVKCTAIKIVKPVNNKEIINRIMSTI